MVGGYADDMNGEVGSVEPNLCSSETEDNCQYYGRVEVQVSWGHCQRKQHIRRNVRFQLLCRQLAATECGGRVRARHADISLEDSGSSQANFQTAEAESTADGLGVYTNLMFHFCPTGGITGR